MQLKGKKVLVTGADGFIGSHLVEALVEKGCEVRALAYYNSFNDWGWLENLDSKVLSQVEVVNGDIRDPHFVREICQGREVVFHLAALIAIPYSYTAPESYVDTNIRGTLNVLMAVRELGIERMVHTSTSEVYGTAQYLLKRLSLQSYCLLIDVLLQQERVRNLIHLVHGKRCLM